MSDLFLQVRGLTKDFDGPAGSTVRAVRQADLTARGGEVLLVLGPSGSGKTTLLSLLAGILPPTAGSVLAAGRDLSRMRPSELQAFRLHEVGFVFQNARLIDGLSAAENVELPLNMAGETRPGASRKALELLEAVDLSHKAAHTVDGLSGGERQRVSVARALALEPMVIFADEPTAMVDAEAGERVVGSLCSAARDRGALLMMVSHDARLSNHATRVLSMEAGVLREVD